MPIELRVLFWGSLIYVCSWLVVAVFNKYLFFGTAQ
jgi:hypothetical protein